MHCLRRWGHRKAVRTAQRSPAILLDWGIAIFRHDIGLAWLLRAWRSARASRPSGLGVYKSPCAHVLTTHRSLNTPKLDSPAKSIPIDISTMQFGTSIQLAIMALATATSAALCGETYPDTYCCQVTGGSSGGCLDGQSLLRITP